MTVNNKYTIIYSFTVVDGRENEFITCWTELTKLIYKNEGSYGSRLHKVNENIFIGYAQWPSKETFDKSGDNLPETANKFRKQMRESCAEIKTIYEMHELQDLLNDKRYTEIEE